MVKREEGTMMNCEIWIELIWYESVDINGNKKWMMRMIFPWLYSVILNRNEEMIVEYSRIVRYEWKWMWIEMNEMG